MTEPTIPAATDTAGRVIVLDVVGLRPEHVDADRTPALESFVSTESMTDLRPPFPAVTVPAQTTLGTGRGPGEHGDISSGEYDRERDAAEFWERDRDGRDRLWETASDEAGLTTGVLNFQHLIGTSADVAVTPSPIEDENNDILEMNCWTNPDGFYDDLRAELGHFPLHNYWGPGANEEGSRWILSAAREAIDRFDPDLLWIYVPHLDYVGQSDGPESDAFTEQLDVVDGLLEEFLDFLSATDRWDETLLTLVSEYGFHEVDRPVFPNRALRDAGLLETADDGDVDLAASDAFAMVDHQIAHVYVDEGAIEAARDALAGLAGLEGIDTVLEEAGKAEREIDHPNAGEFVLVAAPNAWFQYYWWDDRANAPPYATEMDIHAKPGFDPCELFFGDEGLVSLDASNVSGSHGRVDESAFGCFGLGGPAAPALEGDEPVDAIDVAPTIADLLGLEGELSMPFEGTSLRRG
ncbi:alkaline phosphatase family protein [Natrinema salsiterrestre]|uniref:Alkaline phosphatase family protein n=1 Tax=Natrinema salsiterrestre TaxID=2950540 RepID=A0A9Q4Q407_9EURY|nr:nucleotide pyrophosphatase/phosphodiesterase family protein [Natrinema salsiterrestre]MDF9746763.1 alkaline phosphatase family protein [Natrinema salsiterrestre]